MSLHVTATAGAVAAARLYYGVLGPRAPWRAAVVASAGSEFDYADRAVAA